MNLIPAIDLMGGQCVRLFQGGFNAVTYYDFSPTDLANKYEEMGFSKLHIVDLDGSRKGFSNNSSVITEIIKSSGLMVQLGGGIRSIGQIREWIDIGVDRIILGSYAIHNINKLRNSLNDNECSKLIIALDVLFKNNLPVVMTHGWQKSSGKSLWSLLKKFNQENFDNFLVTDISKDGTMIGPNIELYSNCIEHSPESRFTASGGISNISDVIELSDVGLDSTVTGKALLENTITAEEIRKFLRDE